MWRYSYNGYTIPLAKAMIFEANGNFEWVGLNQVPISSPSGYYYVPTIEGIKGKYRLSGSTIELYGLSRFTNDVMDSYDSYSTILNTLQTGSQSDVQKLLDPNHALYDLHDRTWEVFADRSGSYQKIDITHMKEDVMMSLNDIWVKA
jgi:hypothetical protein